MHYFDGQKVEAIALPGKVGDRLHAEISTGLYTSSELRLIRRASS
jgi:hypothetical protein